MSWSVGPGRARPGAARWGLLAWLVVTALWSRFGPPGFVPLLVIAGLYLLGPLWTAVRYTVDGAGIERRTPFGAKRWPWGGLASFRIDRRLRSAWVVPRGRGAARFLPPVLLLWEPGAEDEAFVQALATRLATHLPGRSER